jgi:hypothetical protein
VLDVFIGLPWPTNTAGINPEPAAMSTSPRLRDPRHHHRYLWDELPRIGSLCFGVLRADLEPHLMKEEHVHKENHRLFPLAVELEERLRVSSS